jgi:uncharacterized protein YjiS (DUF1127 family)
METMNSATRTLRPQPFARRLWLWLTPKSRARATAPRLTALSDHTLRDIGVERDRIDRTAIISEYDAMRYSG